MSSPKIWCVCVDHEEGLMGDIMNADFGENVADFRKNVLKESPVNGVNPYELIVWRCKDRTTIFEGGDLQVLEAQVREAFATNNLEPLGPRRTMADLHLSEQETLLVQISNVWQNKRKREGLVDVSTDPYERLKKAKLIDTPPSRVASVSAYKSMQENYEERILDDRPSPDEDIPPIALLYHGFGRFLDICRGQTNVPGLDKVDRRWLKKRVDQFARRMCSYYAKEDERRDKGLESIHDIFQSRSDAQIPRPTAASIGGYRSNGHFIGKHGGAVVVLEFKNEITGITSIPVVEATAYTAQTHKTHMEQFPTVFRSWRVPCLGLTIVGCNVTFYAVIAIHHQYRVVPLTSTLSCLPHANDGDDRETLYSAFTAASVLLACILEDGAEYAVSPLPKIQAGCHQYPAVTRLQRYKSEGFVNFQIQRFHEDRQPHRWLYVAETEGGEQILIKFTRRYSIALHDFCASRDHSPRILGFERLSGGWYGVAMQYFPSATPLPGVKGLQDHGPRWISELQALVESFHDVGFVHGDLRDPNIICDGERFLLIDFDWAGMEGEVSYPFDLDDLNPELLEGRSSTNPAITKGDDIRVLTSTLNKVQVK